MIIMTASGIYVVENKAQPEAFSSIPKAMWWAVVTLTTVGYGDVTPVTSLGKLLGALITILGRDCCFTGWYFSFWFGQ